MSTQLTSAEKLRFVVLEQHVENGFEIFVKVGLALLEIQAKRLYRDEYPTFEIYCAKRWNLSRGHGYRLIAAARVVANLSPMGDSDGAVPLPASERVARPLALLQPEEQAPAWEKAVEESGGEPTAADVTRTVERQRNTGACFTNNRNDWCTPDPVLDRVRMVGEIGLDPCDNDQSITGAQKSFKLEDNGLVLPWTGLGLVYANPPFDDIKLWADKIDVQGTFGAEIITLTAARTDTNWWERLIRGADCWCAWKGRIQFRGGKFTSTFPTALTYRGPAAGLFKMAFMDAGRIWIEAQGTGLS